MDTQDADYLCPEVPERMTKVEHLERPGIVGTADTLFKEAGSAL